MGQGGVPMPEGNGQIDDFHSSPPFPITAIGLREGGQRILEAILGRLYEAGADLADAGLFVGDARVDRGQYARLDDLAQVDAGRRAAEVQRGDPVNVVLALR